MAAGDFILSGFALMNEWGVRVGGFINSCGEAAALMAAHIANGATVSVASLQQLTNAAVAAGEHQGGQNPQGVMWDLAQEGVGSVEESVAQLGATLSANIIPNGGAPVILGVSNGAALTGEPSGLRGHYVTVVGYSASRGAYIVGDPNAYGAGPGQTEYDTLAQLQAASPFAAIVPKGTAVGSSGVAGMQQTGAAAPALDECAQKYNCSQYWPVDPRYAICQGNVTGCRARANIVSTASQNATDYVNGALAGVGADIEQLTGVNSLRDLGWRMLFAAGGCVLIILGVNAFLSGGASRAANETINLVNPGGLGGGAGEGGESATEAGGEADVAALA